MKICSWIESIATEHPKRVWVLVVLCLVVLQAMIVVLSKFDPLLLWGFQMCLGGLLLGIAWLCGRNWLAIAGSTFVLVYGIYWAIRDSLLF